MNMQLLELRMSAMLTREFGMRLQLRYWTRASPDVEQPRPA